MNCASRMRRIRVIEAMAKSPKKAEKLELKDVSYFKTKKEEKKED